jgi:hypothetical protein
MEVKYYLMKQEVTTKEHIFQELNREIFDHADSAEYMSVATKGLSEELIHRISDDKHEPDWMREFRLKALKIFREKAMPKFGPDLSKINFDDIVYYARPGEIKGTEKWEDVAPEIKKTFERLGIPEAEREVLAGVGAQYESNTVYHKYTDTILRLSGTVQGISDTDEWVRLKSHGTWVNKMKRSLYYEFVAVINNYRIKIVIKEDETGSRSFWSVIPSWRINKNTSRRILHGINLEE